MSGRHRRIVPTCSVILFVLSVSPVTAPFATLDLMDLLGGGASRDGARLQSKPAPDEGAVGPGASPDPFTFRHDIVPVSSRVACALRVFHARHLPLRI
jgi:hypothetical protein